MGGRLCVETAVCTTVAEEKPCFIFYCHLYVTLNQPFVAFIYCARPPYVALGTYRIATFRLRQVYISNQMFTGHLTRKLWHAFSHNVSVGFTVG